MTTSVTQYLRETLPAGFVHLDELMPDIVLDIRYYAANNFIGRPICGYGSASAIASIEAAQALSKVQHDLAQYNLGLMIFDAYRPQRAVDQFVAWADDASDEQMKAEFYPDIEKHLLIEQGYLAQQSSHSRGSTFDLTIVSLSADEHFAALDMGSSFDFFGPESWHDFTAISAAQRGHRLLLSTVMTRHGFAPFPMEWWHYTLENEPYPAQYFDFPIP